MNQDDRDKLNAEYAVMCKDRTPDASPVPDYLSDDGECWRAVKALWRKFPKTNLSRWQGRPEIGVDFGNETQLYAGDDESAAALRACVDLKVQVPNV